VEEPTPLAEEHETPAQQTIASARLEAVVRMVERQECSNRHTKEAPRL